ncbi:unnamed protein product, partial [Prorocentrum cordatum]
RGASPTWPGRPPRAPWPPRAAWRAAAPRQPGASGSSRRPAACPAACRACGWGCGGRAPPPRAASRPARGCRRRWCCSHPPPSGRRSPGSPRQWRWARPPPGARRSDTKCPARRGPAGSSGPVAGGAPRCGRGPRRRAGGGRPRHRPAAARGARHAAGRAVPGQGGPGPHQPRQTRARPAWAEGL